MSVKQIALCMFLGAVVASPALAAGHGHGARQAASEQTRSDGRIVVHITKVADPAVNGPGNLKNVTADIVGIRPGMTVAQVRAILNKNYKAFDEQDGASGYDYRGVGFATNDFMAKMFMGHDNGVDDYAERLNVFFGSPAFGNRVASVHRTITYNTTKPGLVLQEYSAVYAQLTKKYGPPSFANKERLFWNFDPNGQLVKCKPYVDCGGDADVFDPDAQKYADKVDKNIALTVSVSVLYAGGGDGGGNGLVRWLDFNIVDYTDQYQDALAVTKQLDDFAKAHVDKIIQNSDKVNF